MHRLPREGLARRGVFDELAFDECVHGAFGETSVFGPFPGIYTGEDRYGFVNMPNRGNVERVALDSIDDIFAQHQVLYVVLRDDDAMRPVEAALAADVIKTLDLLIDATDCLHAAQLVDRTRNRDALPDGQAGQRR